MRTAVIGCGSWGARVAKRLRDTPGVLLSCVIDERADVARSVGHELGISSSDSTAAYLEVMRPDAIVLATPPGSRLEALRLALSAPTGPRQVRIEKPLGLDLDEAEEAAALCAAAGARLTIGFTLLHHPLYTAAFRYLERERLIARRVEAVRIGRAPAHDVDPMLDLGIHAAAIAAHLSTVAEITARYDEDEPLRYTVLHTRRGGVVVDEIAGTVTTPDGDLAVPAGDALSADLAAWRDGCHRGTARVGLRAQGIVEEHLAAARQEAAA